MRRKIITEKRKKGYVLREIQRNLYGNRGIEMERMARDRP